MIQKAKDLHVVIGEKKDGSKAQYIGDEANASQRFNTWSSNQDASDLDGDGDTTEAAFVYMLWYGKGRLIKYKNLST